MAVDIQTVRDGKIAKTFHMENWLSAIGQLRANSAPPMIDASKPSVGMISS